MTTMNITTDILDSTLAAVQQFDIFAARDAASNGTNPPGRFVVLPDASLLCNAAFLSFTPEWSCVIINASKAQRSIPGWGDIELAAQKFRTLTDYQIELVLMDSESPVTLFAEARYRAKPCIPKDVWRDRHCGDVFAARYPVARFLENRLPREAFEQALKSVALHLEPNGGYRTPEVDLGEFACVRNREFARALANRKCLC